MPLIGRWVSDRATDRAMVSRSPRSPGNYDEFIGRGDGMRGPETKPSSGTSTVAELGFSGEDRKNLERLLDASLDAVIGMNRDGRVTAWNKQAEILFGWTRGEALNSVLGDLIIPAHLRGLHSNGLRRYLETGDGKVLNRRIEVEGANRSGRIVPVELTVVPIDTKEGQVFFAFIRDISSRLAHEDGLRQRALQAEVLWEATERVAAGGNVDDLFAACLARICRVTTWAVGHVYLPDVSSQTQRLVSSNVWHFERKKLAGLAKQTENFSFARNEGMPGRIWTSGKPEWIPSIAESQDLQRKEILLGHGLHAAFGFPVYLEGRLQAVLEFFSEEEQRPDKHLLYIIQGLGQQLGRVLERHRAQEHRQLLLKELSHRIGNTLAIVNAVFRLSATHAQTKDDLSISFEARLRNMAEAHRLLAQNDWKSANLAELLDVALKPYFIPEKYLLCGRGFQLPAQFIMPLSMIVNELATDAVDHWGLISQDHHLQIDWSVGEAASGHNLELKWFERGFREFPSREKNGYGSNLVESTLRSLGGSITRVVNSDGMELTIKIPI